MASKNAVPLAPSPVPAEKTARLRAIQALREQGEPDHLIATALGFTTRQSLVRFAGPRRAALQPEPKAAPAEPVRPAPPEPEPAPRRSRRRDMEDVYGERIDHLCGDLGDVWPIERMRAATERIHARRAQEIAQERGVPGVAVEIFRNPGAQPNELPCYRYTTLYEEE